VRSVRLVCPHSDHSARSTPLQGCCSALRWLNVFPDAVDPRMVLIILADPRKVLNDGNAEPLQFRIIANAGLHQHFRSIYRP
jgi:hypothetical protein